MRRKCKIVILYERNNDMVRTREEIQADIDETLRKFREEKEKRKRGESLDVVQKISSEQCKLFRTGFRINTNDIVNMSEDDLLKEQQRIDDLNHRLELHERHLEMIDKNHANPKSAKDLILTKEESKWLEEDGFFSRRQFLIKPIDLEKEVLKQQHYKEDFLLWLKTDAGKRFLENISEHDLQWMKDNYTEEELVGCFGIGFLDQ